MLPRLLLVAFLLAHAAIHAGFLSARPAPAAGAPPWPFDLTRSWALTRLRVAPGLVRWIGVVLVGAVVVGFGLASMAAIGVAPAAWWATGAVLGSIASIALLGLSFHLWLIVGVAIDLIVLWLVVVQAWHPMDALAA